MLANLKGRRQQTNMTTGSFYFKYCHSSQVPISLEDFSIQVIRQPQLVTTQVPQGLVHSVNLCGMARDRYRILNIISKATQKLDLCKGTETWIWTIAALISVIFSYLCCWLSVPSCGNSLKLHDSKNWHWFVVGLSLFLTSSPAAVSSLVSLKRTPADWDLLLLTGVLV